MMRPRMHGDLGVCAVIRKPFFVPHVIDPYTTFEECAPHVSHLTYHTSPRAGCNRLLHFGGSLPAPVLDSLTLPSSGLKICHSSLREESQAVRREIRSVAQNDKLMGHWTPRCTTLTPRTDWETHNRGLLPAFSPPSPLSRSCPRGRG